MNQNSAMVVNNSKGEVEMIKHLLATLEYPDSERAKQDAIDAANEMLKKEQHTDDVEELKRLLKELLSQANSYSSSQSGGKKSRKNTKKSKKSAKKSREAKSKKSRK
jgi:hypothetical protein